MRLGIYAKNKIRHLVRVARTLRKERLDVYDEARELRQTVLTPLFGMRKAAQAELEEMRAPGAGWSSEDAKRREDRRRREALAEVNGRIAEVEAEIAKLDARHDELGRMGQKADRVADAVMKLVDASEQILRDELRVYVDGPNTPRALQRIAGEG